MQKRFPAPGYDGPPDWNDLGRDFTSSMFFDGISIKDLKKRIVADLCFLALPYRDHGPCQRNEMSAAAVRWSRRLLPEVSTFSPIAIASSCRLHIPGPAEPDGEAALWPRLCAKVYTWTGPVIIPPVPGWEDSQELYQIAGTALCAQRPVFVIKEEH